MLKNNEPRRLPSGLVVSPGGEYRVVDGSQWAIKESSLVHFIKMPSKKDKTPEISQRIRIKLKAYDSKIIDKSAKQIIETIERGGGAALGPVPLPTEIHKYTVNRSAFIDKNSREQFEMRIHKRLIDITNPSSKIIDLLMNLNLPAGVDIELKM